jgi:hypothetical protein
MKENMLLPVELIDQILFTLPNSNCRHDIADTLGREFVRDLTLLKLKGVDYICKHGLLHILVKYKTLIKEMEWTDWSMDNASQSGHVDVLQWWKDSGLKMKWSNLSMDWASGNGHVHILQWWKDSGLEMDWSYWSMDVLLRTDTFTFFNGGKTLD